MVDGPNKQPGPEAEGAAVVAAPGSRPSRTPIVFVTNVGDEPRIAETLRAAGYLVVEVVLASLASRAQTQRPHVVILDVDSTGALDEVARLRRLPGGGAIDFVYVGGGEGTIRNADDAMANEGSAFFPRPVDIGALVRRIESLTGGPIARPEARPSTPPPSIPVHGALEGRQVPRHPSSRPPADRPSTLSLPAPGLRTPGPPLPMSTPSLADLVDPPPRSIATFGTVSSELQQLLAEAELRADGMPNHAPEVALPTPEEEIETVLPADVLASLDEPIEGDEDEEQDGRLGDRDALMGAHAKGTTAGGSKQTTASGRGSTGPGSSSHPTRERERDRERDRDRDLTPSRRTSEIPAHHHQQQTPPLRPSPIPPSGGPAPRSVDPATISLKGMPSATFEALQSEDFRTQKFRPFDAIDTATLAITGPPASAAGAWDAQAQQAQSPRESMVNTTRWEPASVAPAVSSGREREDAAARSPEASGSVRPPAIAGIVILRPVDARHFLADAITRRLSGALCFEHERVVRRLVLRDGDLVTAASGAERESLVCFLGARGELPRDEVDRLAGKVPPYGRHAGAALVAHGWLGQDQLWVALRAHAEWIATGVLRLGGGTAQLEAEPPGRLRSEPSVFGASTGAEIFVELVRRAVAPRDAIEALGGEASRLSEGHAYALLSECALPPQELELITRSRGGSVGDVLARAPEADVASVLHALHLLNVLDILPASDPLLAERGAGAARAAAPPSETELEAAALDEEALRARIRARLELVDEGDYFSVLGLSRDATSYEVRRAFLELRRAFEPTRILSPRLADLAEDVRKIVIVLEEAYEILRDVARRERYRKAIEGRPS